MTRWHRGGDVQQAFEESLQKLGVDYVDIVRVFCFVCDWLTFGILNSTCSTFLKASYTKVANIFPRYPYTQYISDGREPTADSILKNFKVVDKPDFNEMWADIEKIYESGKARAIGVSNFSVKT